MNVLEIKNIKKSFNDQTLHVLKDISLHVEEGEVVAIIGPSGSGKSTLLRCATLLTDMTEGELAYKGEAIVTTVDGKAVYADKAALKKARGCFGLVFQNFNLFPQYTVLENVMLAPQLLQRGTKEQIEQMAKKLLAQVGLSDKLNFYPWQLSGGQQQRVAIARALAMKPHVLCFDEPTSALDPELTGEVLRVIRDLKKENTTMIVVTHEMEFAKSVADVIIYMAEGVIEEIGTPQEIFENPTSEKLKAFLHSSLETV